MLTVNYQCSSVKEFIRNRTASTSCLKNYANLSCAVYPSYLLLYYLRKFEVSDWTANYRPWLRAPRFLGSRAAALNKVIEYDTITRTGPKTKQHIAIQLYQSAYVGKTSFWKCICYFLVVYICNSVAFA